MGLLKVEGLSHTYGEKLLYKDSSFQVFKGEHVGLIGKNGTGKTTLLNSIIGKVVPDEGEIRWQKGINIGYLDQHANLNEKLTLFEYLKTAFYDLYKMEEKLNEIYTKMAENFTEEIFEKSAEYQSSLESSGFYDIESTIMKVASGLGILSFGMENFLGTLSGGQKAKVILGKLLLQKPDILLLDEPTNFLDKEHVEWLGDYLKQFKGSFIVISHDFEFLDKITNAIIDIEFNAIKKYPGNFSKFIKIKGLQRESYIKEYKAQQKEIKKHEEFIAKNRVRASTARQAQSRIKLLNKMEKISPPEIEPKPTFSFQCESIGCQKALIVNNLEIGYTHSLLHPFNFEIMPTEKVVITGFNGIGKSTLLKTLVGAINPLKGWFHFSENTKFAYYEQDLKWDNKSYSPIEIVGYKFPMLSQKEIRKCLAQCGIKSEHVLRPIGTLSGGEQAKVKLCILMLTRCNFLILDEPTNHLDVDAKEVLNSELSKWEGGLILVSHESSFYKNWCSRVINIVM